MIVLEDPDPALVRVQNAICRIPAVDGDFKILHPVRRSGCPRDIIVFIDDLESSRCGQPKRACFVVDENEVAIHDDASLGSIVEQRVQFAVMDLKSTP